MYLLTSLLAETESTQAASGSGSARDLVKIFKSPVLYIVLGAIILLILVFYFVRRFVKGSNNTIIVVTRKGKIYKLIDEKTNRYFLVPFKDSVGARITLDNKLFTSDKLFINDGPDHLYKINFNLEYKVTDIETYFYKSANLQNLLETRINDSLRDFADQGNAQILVKDYKANTNKILEILNNSSKDFGIEFISFKVNFIQPLGGK